MKNLGLAGAIALCGIGLILIGLGNFKTQTVYAAPAVAAATAVQDKSEPTIVWYGTTQGVGNNELRREVLIRAWSNGTVEARLFTVNEGCQSPTACSNWGVVSSPTEGMTAAADINFDEVIDGADLASLLAKWGEAPRVSILESDCPLGLLNP